MDVYISADIEADGPIPGPYSMLAVGLAVVADYDGKSFRPRLAASETFYRELKPISANFDTAALRVARLDRNLLERSGSDPAEAMNDAATWVTQRAAGCRPVLVGYPLVFDWMFLHWYFVRFAGSSPFGFSSALDMKTMYQQKARVTVEASGRQDLPRELRSARRHTHNALDDAIEQGEIFNRLYVWMGNQDAP